MSMYFASSFPPWLCAKPILASLTPNRVHPSLILSIRGYCQLFRAFFHSVGANRK
jgi:hypothetical protein